MTRSKIKQPAHPVFQSKEEVDMAIFNLGAAQRALTEVTTEMDTKIATIHVQYMNQINELKDQQEKLTAGIQAWCNANRSQMTDGDKVKFIRFTNGEVHWRFPGWSVVLKGKVKVETVLNYLKQQQKKLLQAKLPSFIRTKEEIDKEALLKHREEVQKLGLDYISFSNREDFSVEPFESKTSVH